ncbi:DUF3152 domain-containing protein [Streptomyces netropsis]|uniref:DUF3152 domain-containing protein n=1 Tax=Streptomyces netropsis TaxID=55404 RepID=UPI003BB7286A
MAPTAPGTGRRRAPAGQGPPAQRSAAPSPDQVRHRAVPGQDGPGGRRDQDGQGYAAGVADHVGGPAGEAIRPSARSGHPVPAEPGLGWGFIGPQRGESTRSTGHGHAPPGHGATVFDGHGHGSSGHDPDVYENSGSGPSGQAPAPAAYVPPVYVPSGDYGSDDPDRTPLPTPRGTGGGGNRRVAVPRSGGPARTVTGVAAAVVTAVLAVVVGGQVEDTAEGKAQARSADVERHRSDAASRSDSRPTPNGGAAVPLTYDQKMAKKYPLDAKAKASGTFESVGGHDRGPGKGEVLRYRVDVEKGLPLDGALFAEAVHKTLNDDRSWGHGGKRTFERVPSGDADFVVTLASPGTTHTWCAKSGLDTTQDNVSCDSAATDRVMINAYRWAQGAQTYGDQMHAYRQMLINHEVGHRLGRDHESCEKQGALAPVMMQQTKFLTTDGVTCRPNAWPFPKGG